MDRPNDIWTEGPRGRVTGFSAMKGATVSNLTVSNSMDRRAKRQSDGHLGNERRDSKQFKMCRQHGCLFAGQFPDLQNAQQDRTMAGFSGFLGDERYDRRRQSVTFETCGYHHGDKGLKEANHSLQRQQSVRRAPWRQRPKGSQSQLTTVSKNGKHPKRAKSPSKAISCYNHGTDSLHYAILISRTGLVIFLSTYLI